MKERKLTIEIVVDQKSKDWRWLIESVFNDSAEPVNGIIVKSISEDWTSRRTEELLRSANNVLIDLKRSTP